MARDFAIIAKCNANEDTGKLRLAYRKGLRSKYKAPVGTLRSGVPDAYAERYVVPGLGRVRRATRRVLHGKVEEPPTEAVIADTFAGRVHVEWDEAAAVTPLGQLPFFVEFLKQASLFDAWVADSPLRFTSPGAEVGYNPHKPGRPSHSLQTYVMANLRLVLDAEAYSGKQHASRHSQDGLWRLLKSLPRSLWPRMVRGDNNWGSDLVMRRSEEEGLAYLLRLRLTANVKRALERAMSDLGWTQAGQGWQGKEVSLKLHGWGRALRVILLRRRLKGGVSLAARNERGQLALGFAKVETDEPVWEHCALVTSLSEEILSFGQLYHHRADCENVYDEIKNQWGWGGFTTQDLARCQLMARVVALAYNWWPLFARLAEPDRHREAITPGR